MADSEVEQLVEDREVGDGGTEYRQLMEGPRSVRLWETGRSIGLGFAFVLKLQHRYRAGMGLSNRYWPSDVLIIRHELKDFF